jgi:hypothetical protein
MINLAKSESNNETKGNTMKVVNIEQVSEFTKVKASSSYMQTERHTAVSERYQVIQPAMIGAKLAERGFNLISCITGKARHEDKIAFQRTISRYRSQDAFGIEGCSLDLIYISKHRGLGQDEIRLGLFRGACANQWNVGTLFELIKVRHTGNVLEDLETGIAAVLSQRDKLVSTIQAMQRTVVDAAMLEKLAREFALIRLQGKKNVIDVNFRVLARERRPEDASLDLFTVANVLQENALRFPLQYRIETTDSQGNKILRNQSTRQLRESSSQLVDLNGQFFDAAMQLAA